MLSQTPTDDKGHRPPTTPDADEKNSSELPTPVKQSTKADDKVKSTDIEKLSTSQKAHSDDINPLQLTPSAVQAPSSPLHEIPFIFTLCMAQLLAQAGLGQCVAPIHIIGDSFGTQNPGQLSWMPAAYSLTVGTFILVAGRLGDLFGHKLMLISGFCWFAFASLLTGVSVWSSSIIFFDVCRALQGMGPAFAVPSAVAIIGRTYPVGLKKALIFSLFGATAPGGFVVGAVFSSIFAELVWWPWAYFVMAMACTLMAAISVVTIPSTPGLLDSQPRGQVWKMIDVPGAAAGVLGLVLINFAWNQGPNVGWSTPYVYIILIIGALALCVFGWIEAHSDFPLLPRDVFNGSVGFVLGCVAAGWSSFGIWMFYIWQFAQQIRGKTSLVASAEFSAAAVSGACAAFATAVIIGKVQLRPSIVMFLALSAFTTGGILIATTPASQSYWAQTFLSVIVMPWGMDMSFPAATIILSQALPKEHQGIAASLVNTIVNYSISIGLGIAGTVQSQIMKKSDNADLLTGFRSAFYVGIGLSGLGMCLSIIFIIYESRKKFLERRKAG